LNGSVSFQADVLVNTVHAPYGGLGPTNAIFWSQEAWEAQGKFNEIAVHGIRPGEIMWTSAYELPCKAVYHCCITRCEESTSLVSFSMRYKITGDTTTFYFTPKFGPETLLGRIVVDI